jgi:hypothetical protein
LITGIHQGISTAQLARELHCHRNTLATLRHCLQAWVVKTFGVPPHTKRKVTRGKPPPLGRASHTEQFGKKSRRGKKSG